MSKLLKIVLAGALVAGIAATTASADVVKGQKLFAKKLKSTCGMTGAEFARSHSQDDWKALKDGGKFEEEIIKICPEVKAGDIKKSWQEDIYDFAYEYANDSGVVPSC
ncbi:MAG: cytochrome C [Candidatus Marinarcus sp.]|uniref:cytochrome C n=1 Tax=Candidatus Marinarcus sp. TaxID=3100987 RepID=UPI003B000F0D